MVVARLDRAKLVPAQMLAMAWIAVMTAALPIAVLIRITSSSPTKPAGSRKLATMLSKSLSAFTLTPPVTTMPTKPAI